MFGSQSGWDNPMLMTVYPMRLLDPPGEAISNIKS